MMKDLANGIVTLYNAAISGDKAAVMAAYRGIETQTVAKYGENAFAAILIMSIMAVVVGAVMLLIGIFVTATVGNAIPTGSLTAAQNTSLTNANSNVATAFTLLGIILIVGGAGGIIAVLLGFVGPGTTGVPR